MVLSAMSVAARTGRTRSSCIAWARTRTGATVSGRTPPAWVVARAETAASPLLGSPYRTLHTAPFQMQQAATAVTEAPTENSEKPEKPEPSTQNAKKPEPRTKSEQNGMRLFDSLNDRLHNLNLELQRKGRILHNEVKELCSIASRLHKRGQYCSPNQALLILRCFGDLFADAKREERSKLALEMWDLFGKTKTKLDVSHYNALLKTHVENEYEFAPSEFLSNMESLGIEPNRVTFQYFVARYCHLGDMAGATAILEHMKKSDMAINEAIFHSLILGHCKSGDLESAKSVLGIMDSSGLTVGAETHIIYLTGMIRSGQPWEAVKARLDEMVAKEVQFHDHDYLRLMLELVRVKKNEAAREIMSLLPRKSGFFQEVRNIIPQLIFEGDPELAFELYSSLNIFSLGSDGHRDSKNRDNGLFILRAMVTNEYEPAKVVSILKRLLDSNSEAATRIIEYCIEENKTEYGSKIRELVEKECGPDFVKGNNLSFYLRRNLAEAQSEEDVIRTIVEVVKTGVRIAPSTISNDIMPKLLKDSKVPVHHVLRRLREAVEKVTVPLTNKADGVKVDETSEELAPQQMSWTVISNCGIQYLLNTENDAHFKRATTFVLLNHLACRPRMWNASLARAYLATGDLKSLVSFIFTSANRASKSNDPQSDETHAYHTLVHIHSNAHRYRGQDDQILSADNTLATILEDLKSHHIGIPEETAAILRPNLDSDSVKSLLEELVAVHKEKDAYWTLEKRDEFIESRIEMSLGRKRRNSRFEAGRAAKDSIRELVEADNVAAAIECFEKLVKEEKKVTGKTFLMKKLIEIEDMERMQRVLDLSIEVIGEERSLYDLASDFLELGKLPQARKLLETPGLRYNQQKVNYICERLIEYDRREALEAFVRFSKLVFACDRDFLYSKLIEAYKGNPKKVSDIWITIQEEGHTPSNGLKEQIATVLRAAGAEVPFHEPGPRRQRKPKKEGEGAADSTETKLNE